MGCVQDTVTAVKYGSESSENLKKHGFPSPPWLCVILHTESRELPSACPLPAASAARHPPRSSRPVGFRPILVGSLAAGTYDFTAYNSTDARKIVLAVNQAIGVRNGFAGAAKSGVGKLAWSAARFHLQARWVQSGRPEGEGGTKKVSRPPISSGALFAALTRFGLPLRADPG